MCRQTAPGQHVSDVRARAVAEAADDQDPAQHVLQVHFTWVEDGVLSAAPEGPWIAEAEPGPRQQPNVARRFLPSTRAVSLPGEHHS